MSRVLEKSHPLQEQLENTLLDDFNNPFDAAKWLSEKVGESEETLRVSNFARKKSFKQICTVIRNELRDIIDDSQEQSGNNELLERQHDAVIGKLDAMGYFVDKIKEVLRKQNITSNEYPSFYDSLADAVFHEVWGLSILTKWEKYPNSEAAVIRGTELWIDIDGKFVKQQEEFEDERHVDRIKRAFTMRSEDSVINKQNPELEVEKEDGSRITMIQNPRSRENYIMLRRFVVKNLSLYEQARLNTIPERDVPIYQALSRTMPNTIIAGRVRSAKSTFMKSMIRERDPSYVIASMEKHFELHLKEHMPDRLIFEVQAKEGDLHTAVPRLLRMEHDFIVVGEIRSLEMEGFMQAAERGERGSYSTYHLTDVNNVVPQLTRHLLDEFPNRTPEIEIERVARNLDIIITMSTERDRRKKRVIGVTEVCWDEEKRKPYVTDLIRYSKITQKYYYSSNLSNRLYGLMMEENLDEAKKLMSLLKERERESSMSNYHQLNKEEW
ncbi:ATPase, T2SS/T4P/T4SS family [Alkalihalobacillus sp. BA299]|uniref:ATPase, T2SS/T4P/T4SS family n=1 Tax=Alkalihalobacillus sp. BA299 TaxID=2815938 RepID=UPI001ADB0D0B|nr:ATPase, T2SS/T4P/T4SS family [Alkalihalobacillus sp. BA299]